MTLKKIYKYGFWLLLLVTITLGNIMRITNIKCDERISYQSKIYTKRIISLLDDSFSKPKKIALVSGVDLYTYESYTDLFSTTTIAILLSDFDCAKCQEMELLKIASIKEELNQLGAEVYCFTTKDKQPQAIVQKKALKLNYDIYILSEREFEDKLSLNYVYPQILFVKNGIVLTSHLPIAKDFDFSENFYERILNIRETSQCM